MINKNAVRRSAGDNLFYFLVAIICILAFAITLFPFIHVFSASFSEIRALLENRVYLWPVGIDFASYQEIFKLDEVWISYYNTIWYTVVGTAISIFVTTCAAYPLSRKSFTARRKVMLMFAFTMYFSGGLIPFYMVVNNLGMYNTRWALVIPTALNVFNLIICKTSFEGMPEEIYESAKIDGCTDVGIFFKMVLPLQKAIVSVLVLYYAVANWNSFFNALLFISGNALQPIQLFLRRILIQSSPEILLKMGLDNLAGEADRYMISLQMKYAVVIVGIGPILLIYPFIQKYLVKGVMIGAIKG